MNTLTWEEFDKLELPKERWLIQYLLPREGFVIIASPSGEKKTWFAMAMAECIANGGNFLGNSDFKAEKGNVLYIDEEMPEAELQRRGRLLGLNKTASKIYLANKNDLKLNNDANMLWLQGFVMVENIRVIFIDTLRAVAGGLNEDKAEDVRAFFDRFKTFKNLGVVIVFLDHCRKPNHFEGKLPKKEQVLGSQDKLASIETLIMIKSEERTNDIFVYQKKNRSGVEYDPFRIEMKELLSEKSEGIEIERIELKYAGKIEEKEYKFDKAKNLIMDFLATEGKRRQHVISFLTKEYKIGAKNASDALRALEVEGKITSKKEGRENFYEINTDVGHREEEDIDTKFNDF